MVCDVCHARPIGMMYLQRSSLERKSSGLISTRVENTHGQEVKNNASLQRLLVL